MCLSVIERPKIIISGQSALLDVAMLILSALQVPEFISEGKLLKKLSFVHFLAYPLIYLELCFRCITCINTKMARIC